MPKIVDREKVRAELVAKAVKIFQEKGYSGLGMRQIAQELGMSKSALYHYFPSKESLFEACTEWVTRQEWEIPEGEISEVAPSLLLQGIVEQMEGDFQGELSLLVDYLRGKTPEDVSEDGLMQLANQRYLGQMTRWVGEYRAKPMLCFLYGLLLQRLLDGGQTEVEDMKEWLERAF